MGSKRQPQRTVQAAIIQDFGLVSARELIAMPEDEWGILRDRITDFAVDKDGGRLARCMHCNSRVFIQTRVSGEKRLPYFVHFYTEFSLAAPQGYSSLPNLTHTELMPLRGGTSSIGGRSAPPPRSLHR